MRCPNDDCGFEGPGKFCPECGVQLVQTIESRSPRSPCRGVLDDNSPCTASLQQGQKFCQLCGVKVDMRWFDEKTITCQVCSAVLGVGVTICPNCGPKMTGNYQEMSVDERGDRCANVAVGGVQSVTSDRCEQKEGQVDKALDLAESHGTHTSIADKLENKIEHENEYHKVEKEGENGNSTRTMESALSIIKNTDISQLNVSGTVNDPSVNESNKVTDKLKTLHIEEQVQAHITERANSDVLQIASADGTRDTTISSRMPTVEEESKEDSDAFESLSSKDDYNGADQLDATPNSKKKSRPSKKRRKSEKKKIKSTQDKNTTSKMIHETKLHHENTDHGDKADQNANRNTVEINQTTKDNNQTTKDKNNPHHSEQHTSEPKITATEATVSKLLVGQRSSSETPVVLPVLIFGQGRSSEISLKSASLNFPRSTLFDTATHQQDTSVLMEPEKATSVAGTSFMEPEKATSVAGTSVMEPEKATSVAGTSVMEPEKATSVAGTSVMEPEKATSVAGTSVMEPEKATSVAGTSVMEPEKATSVAGTSVMETDETEQHTDVNKLSRRRKRNQNVKGKKTNSSESTIQWWNLMFIDDKLQSREIQEDWNAEIGQSLRQKLDTCFCYSTSTHQFVQLYCQRIDAFRSSMQECLNETAFKAIGSGYNLNYRGFTDSQKKRFGYLLSDMFETEWGKAMRTNMNMSEEERILTHVLHWSPCNYFLQMFCSDTNKFALLSDNCKMFLTQTVPVIDGVYKTLASGDMTVGRLQQLQAPPQRFPELVKLAVSGQYIQTLVERLLKVRHKELETFELQAEFVTTLTSLCHNNIPTVDLKDLDSVLDKKVHIEVHKIAEFCKPMTVSEETDLETCSPFVIAFPMSDEVLRMLPVLHECNKSNIFLTMWEQQCSVNGVECCNLDDVVVKIWDLTRQRYI